MKDRFGWSFRQFKTRLTYLDPVISDKCQGGNGQAIQVDQDGLVILERQYQLEMDGYSVKEGAEKIIQEIDNPQPTHRMQEM